MKNRTERNYAVCSSHGIKERNVNILYSLGFSSMKLINLSSETREFVCTTAAISYTVGSAIDVNYCASPGETRCLHHSHSTACKSLKLVRCGMACLVSYQFNRLIVIRKYCANENEATLNRTILLTILGEWENDSVAERKNRRSTSIVHLSRVTAKHSGRHGDLGDVYCWIAWHSWQFDVISAVEPVTLLRCSSDRWPWVSLLVPSS